MILAVASILLSVSCSSQSVTPETPQDTEYISFSKTDVFLKQNEEATLQVLSAPVTDIPFDIQAELASGRTLEEAGVSIVKETRGVRVLGSVKGHDVLRMEVSTTTGDGTQLSGECFVHLFG